MIDGSKSGVSTQHRIACREAFSSYDAAGNGKVDIGTLALVLKAVGHQVTKFKLDGIIADEVSNKDQFTFSEFLAIVARIQGKGSSTKKSEVVRVTEDVIDIRTSEEKPKNKNKFGGKRNLKGAASEQKSFEVRKSVEIKQPTMLSRRNSARKIVFSDKEANIAKKNMM